MREVDDVEQAENDGQAHAQDGVEAAVDQPHEQLGEQGGKGDVEHDGRRAAWVALRLVQRAGGLGLGENVFALEYRFHVVVVPRGLGLRRRLHLQQQHVVHQGAVRAHLAITAGAPSVPAASIAFR
ncbi:hypothetical protein G6F22_020716 [Rhizopus arrhizus]|nr:hypothetical protein G6F22_020716 [Rhizopus arrhizus]